MGSALGGNDGQPFRLKTKFPIPDYPALSPSTKPEEKANDLGLDTCFGGDRLLLF